MISSFKRLCLYTSVLLLSFSSAWAQLSVINLKCEYISNPIAIQSQHPVLSWQLQSPQKAKKQSAYKVIVASSPTLLAQRKGDCWNSGKVISNNSAQVMYKGKPLSTKQKLYWAVMVWDEKGIPSQWSSAGNWSMGLVKPSEWKAKWIGKTVDESPDKTTTYPAPYFRKDLITNKKVKQAIAYVSGLGFYELYINGKKIGDQVLAPAVTNYDVRPLKKLLYPYDDQSTQRVLYNTFDVTGNLLSGKNTIGMLLGNGWYNQRDRTVEGTMWYDVPKLIFQLEITYNDGTKAIVVSDESWKTNTGPLLKDGIFSGEQYDARLELGYWNKPNYNASDWQNAIAVRPPTGNLQPQTAPFDKVTRTLRPHFDGKVKDGVYKYRLDQTVSGWAALTVKGRTGDKVSLRFISEEGQDYGQFDTYTLKGNGTETWEPKFTWHAFRTIEATTTGVELNEASITVKDVHTEVAQSGTFECSDTLLNTINTAYLKTQLANLHGSISSDCPHRERLAYTGDGQVAMESALLSFNMPQFYRKWFEDIDDARNHKTGFVTHTAPFGGGGGGPAWGSAYVIMPWLYYSYYGDTQVLRQHYEGMKHWVQYLQTRTDERGLITREEPKGWCLGDWCTPDNINLPEPLVNTAYYYYCAKTMGKIADLLQKPADSQQFLAMAGQIKANFNKVYFNAAQNSYWEGRQGSDVFALAFGLVPDGHQAAVFDNLIKHLEKLNYHFDTGILATPLLLKVLAGHNRDDIAFKLMTQRDFPSFGYLLDKKNSMLWEEWKGGGSHAHPMFGSVVSWMYASLGGINVSEPGMQQFRIAPKPVGDLKYCKASYNSLFGKIRSEWKKNTDGSLDVLIEIPVNTSATFVLPDGKTVLKDTNGKPSRLKKVGGHYVADLGSGIYKLKVL